MVILTTNLPMEDPIESPKRKQCKRADDAGLVNSVANAQHKRFTDMCNAIIDDAMDQIQNRKDRSMIVFLLLDEVHGQDVTNGMREYALKHISNEFKHKASLIGLQEWHLETFPFCCFCSDEHHYAQYNITEANMAWVKTPIALKFNSCRNEWLDDIKNKIPIGYVESMMM